MVRSILRSGFPTRPLFCNCPFYVVCCRFHKTNSCRYEHEKIIYKLLWNYDVQYTILDTITNSFCSVTDLSLCDSCKNLSLYKLLTWTFQVIEV